MSGSIVPVEVKASTNNQAKSLLTYCQRFQPRRAVRTSLRPYSTGELEFKKPQYKHTACLLTELPLYAISCLKAETATF